MAVNSRNGQDLKPYSLEHIANQSFDQDAQINVVELVGYDSTNNQLVKVGTNSDGTLQTDISLQVERLLQMLKPLGIVTGSGSNRLSVDINSGTITALTTVTTVTGVTTLTNQTNFGNVNAFTQQQAILRNTYANGIASKLSFS